MAIKKPKIPHHYIKKITKIHKKQFESSLRYERFMVEETFEDWYCLLGKDVLFLSHPHFTAKIAKEFINFHNQIGLSLTNEEQVLLVTASYIHDWGELKIGNLSIGDITFEKHNENHKKIEVSIFKRVINCLPKDKTKDLIHKAYQKIVMTKNSKLGEIFNVVERIGYLKTGLRAYQGIKGKRIKNWCGLVGNVLSNQIIVLIDYAKKYPYIKNFLNQNQKIINKIFKEILKTKVPLDKENQLSYNLNKLKKAYCFWKKLI